MNPSTAQKLIELNRQFYTRFGAEFSSTRQRLQPGVRQILDSLRGDESILDIGCGNGELARELTRRGFHGSYLGLDFSPPLLAAASRPHSFPAKFAQADLTSNTWALDLQPATFDDVFAFAVLHHIPSIEARLDILRTVKKLLKPGGKFILSNWQFLNSEKLKARIQSWDGANLRADEVDEGDYLLDWRSGGNGLRYAHHFSGGELSALADQIEMRVSASFLSDGEGKNLGLYQVWEIG
ncbi:MAG: class I SAM-dependent methyltransferase [Anaerolineales bacterium]|nr:class I SAM-dependent methyltransferase [Anaerolineales bacterium]